MVIPGLCGGGQGGPDAVQVVVPPPVDAVQLWLGQLSHTRDHRRMLNKKIYIGKFRELTIIRYL